MLENILVGLISGVAASVVASFVFLYATRRQVSDIKMSKDIILKDSVLMVKFVNTSKQPIAGVKVLMYGAKYKNANKSSVHFCLLSEKTIPFIHGYDKSDEQLKFAIVASLPLSDVTIDNMKKDYHDVHIWVIGADTYYGNHVAISSVYSISDAKQGCIFELGENTATRKLD